MDVKETRGRKPKHNYIMSVGQVVSKKSDKTTQNRYLVNCKKLGYVVRSWNEGGKLYVKRIS